MDTTKSDNIFFTKVTKILAKDNSKQSLLELYTFLSNYFPIEGMVIHYLYPPYNFLTQSYFINKKEIHCLEKIIPIEREHTIFLHARAMHDGVYNMESNQGALLAYANDSNIQHLLPFKHRAHLFFCLQLDNNALGIIRLLGNNPECFTLEHERLLNMLQIPFQRTLKQILNSEEVQTFFHKYHIVQHTNAETVTAEPTTLVAASKSMIALYAAADKLSVIDAPVLIFGETGTGKELIAEAIQANSIRRNKPFIKVNCGAIPENLIDSVLFGHEKGAFTGAHKSTAGKFEQAHGGTLFLDELGELSLTAQVRLLRVLQNHQLDRIGSTQSILIDVRIIAATNKNIKHMIEQRLFRDDLFYRLNVFSLSIPPLRERVDDIFPLAEYFIKRMTKKMNLPQKFSIHEESLKNLQKYHWPGNVRELENVIMRALILGEENELKPDLYLDFDYIQKINTRDKTFVQQSISEEALSEETQEDIIIPHLSNNEENGYSNPYQLPHGLSLEEITKRYIIQSLIQSSGRIYGKNGAAEILRLNAETLRKKLLKLGINHNEYKNK